MMLRILFIAFLFISCQGSELTRSLQNSDSVMVIFVNRYEGTIEKQVESSEKNAINKLAHFVDGKPLPDRACIPDGFIAFIKGSAITRFDFSFSDTCKTFSIQKEGKTTYSRMSGEAYDFLQSLKSGNNFY